MSLRIAAFLLDVPAERFDAAIRFWSDALSARPQPLDDDPSSPYVGLEGLGAERVAEVEDWVILRDPPASRSVSCAMTDRAAASAGSLVTDDAAVIAFEQLAARSWPAPESQRLGPWLLRAGEGWTGRANSALPLEPTAELDAWLPEVTGWYAARGLPPRVAAPSPTFDDLRAVLHGQGWRAGHGAEFMTAGIEDVLARLPARGELPGLHRSAVGGYHGHGGRRAPTSPRPGSAPAAKRVDGGTSVRRRPCLAAGRPAQPRGATSVRRGGLRRAPRLSLFRCTRAATRAAEGHRYVA